MKLQARSRVYSMVLGASVLASGDAFAMTQGSGGLHVRVFPAIAHAGEQTRVEVLASVPPSMYAFASARYSVFSTAPAWRSVSAGRVVGDDVLGIVSSQAHMPQQGVFADPTNPYPVWSGVLAPEVRGPALVEVSAAPRELQAYPSRFTGSSVPIPSEGTSGFLFIDPLQVGMWGAAPRAGTRSTVSDDVIVDGRIITGENYDSVGLGLLPLTASAPRATGVRVEFDRLPERYFAGVQIELAGLPVETHSLNFTKVDFDGAGRTQGVVVGAGPGGGAHVKARLTLGASIMYSGVLPRGDATESWTCMLPTVPPEQHTEVGGLVYSGENGGIFLSTRLSYDRPVVALVRDAQGRTRRISVDALEIELPIDARPAHTSNNIRQLGLGVHTFEAQGVEALRLRPRPAE